MKKTAVLIGKAPGKEEAPEKGEYLWGLNDLILFRPNLTLSFEMHDVDKFMKHQFMRDEVKALNDAGIPVICQKHYDAIPKSFAFPIDEMPSRYFTSSIAYMLAYAVHQQVERIEMYGIQMATRVEYVNQRPCCEFWIGYAMAKGIDVYVNRPSQLLFSERGRYGYDWDNQEQGFAWPEAVVTKQNGGILFTKI